MTAARKKSPSESGAAAERAAEAYLQAQGLVPITRNYRSRFGEIDLIMQDGATLVFVEVRRRHHAGAYADAIASIDLHKQRRLAKVAQRYLAWKAPQAHDSRFDVVAVGAEIEWIKDAFTLDDLF